MFTETSTIDQITVSEHGVILVRTANRVLRDGAVIAENYHRASLQPGDDLAGQAPRVVAIAGAVWTPEVVAAYQALTQA